MVTFVGRVTISEAVTLTVKSDLNGSTPQFTLTCISTGGPATTVTWTRNNVAIIVGTETELVNNSTATYVHNLTANAGGEYKCSVTNTKPSEASASFTVEGAYTAMSCVLVITLSVVASPPSGVTAVQDGPTSIRVSWTPSSDATGYRIQYEGSGGDNDTVIVDGGSSNNHLYTDWS